MPLYVPRPIQERMIRFFRQIDREPPSVALREEAAEGGGVRLVVDAVDEFSGLATPRAR